MNTYISSAALVDVVTGARDSLRACLAVVSHNGIERSRAEGRFGQPAYGLRLILSRSNKGKASKYPK